ncbi:MAG TPA: glycosyltransferase family 2 protein [Puia sp.]|nr:glycosyltransferase family 2 protein [Puia sp.]
MIQLSIIIVNYKSARLILDCLETVYRETMNIAFEMIIVDNDSRDDSKDIILSRFPKVRWVSMSYNAGFARANNEGIRQSSGAVILLLNPDTLIENNGIEKCYEYFVQSSYAACGVQLLNPDRTPQISGNYFVKGGLNYLLPLPYLGRCIRWLGRNLNTAIPHLANSDSVIEVDWINGAFLMAKQTSIEKAGLMDEDFFLYAEEAEWCSRLKKSGRLCIVGFVKIIHLQGETANKIFESSGKGYYNLYNKKGLQIMLSNLVRIRKQFGTGWFLFHLFVDLAEIPIFFVGIILSTLFKGKRSAYSFSQFSGYTKNIFSIVRLSPAIIRNKPHFYKVL